MNIDRMFGPRSLQRTWVAAAIVGGSAITAGAGIYSSSQNKGMPNITNTFTPGPNAAAGKTATDTWLSQLQQDQSDPNWGAISPDWNDIWQQTQKHVQQYYGGGPMSPGVNDQIKASFAQRGMSGDPAASFLTAQSGANEASDLSNLGAQQNIAKQQFANAGKTQWLNSIASLQNQAANGPSGGNWGGQVISPTSGQQIGQAVGAFGGGLASYGLQAQGQNNQLDWLTQMLHPSTTTFAPGGSFSNTAPYTVPNAAAF